MAQPSRKEDAVGTPAVSSSAPCFARPPSVSGKQGIDVRDDNVQHNSNIGKQIRVALFSSPKYHKAVCKVLRARNFDLITTGPCVLDWSEFSLTNWESWREGKRKASHLYIRSGLVQKASLAFCLLKSGSPFLPPHTKVLDFEDIRDVEELNNLHFPLVAKRSDANRGEHMGFFESKDALLAFFRKESRGEYVLQDYVFPHLIDGYKYHVRALCLVNGCEECGESTAFLHRPSVICLLAGKQFVREARWDDVHVHGTNWTVNKDLPAPPCTGARIRPAHAVSSLDSHVMDAIADSMREALQETSKRPILCAPLPHCFELFAFDFIVSDDVRVYLLEVNAGPDMDMFSDEVLHQLADDMASIVVPKTVWPNAFRSPGEECSCKDARPTWQYVWGMKSRFGQSVDECRTNFGSLLNKCGLFANALHERASVTPSGIHKTQNGAP